MQPFVEISPPVPENIFEAVLTFMGMVVILVMRPELFIQTLVPPSYRCFISNLALIGKVVSEKDIFENYGNIHTYLYEVQSESSRTVLVVLFVFKEESQNFAH